MYTLLYLFLIVVVQKCDFLKVIKTPCPKIRFLVNLRSFFSTYQFFPGRGCLIPVSTFQMEYFEEKMSSPAVLKKNIQFLVKVPILAIFDYLGPHSKSIFSTYRQNFEKSSVNFLKEVARNIVSNFGLSIFKIVRGVSRFSSRLFPKSVISASCHFVGRPFVACYVCSIVIFLSY